MVLPMGMMGAGGQPTAYSYKIRPFVVAIIALHGIIGIGRIVAMGPTGIFPAISDFAACGIGLWACKGFSMSFFISYIMIALMVAVFDFISLMIFGFQSHFVLFSGDYPLAQNILVAIYLISPCIAISGSRLAWLMVKDMRGDVLSDDAYNPILGGQTSQPSATYQSIPQVGFVPFQGEGRKLG
eukprot:GDKH01002120.1.p1 GENE.GDKH01002120.1~~GDKH01002120.1.p1  ORF type:complete len:184 (-),score=11.11 GDKH01002120.1:367-918(-)